MGVKERKLREFKKREQDILTTTFNLLRRLEPPQVTMELIAESLEIGRGTAYKHFRSKNEILACILINRRESFILQLTRLSQRVENSLTGLIREYVAYCTDDTDAFRIHKKCERFLDEENLSRSLKNKLQTQQEQQIDLVEKIFNRGLSQPMDRKDRIYVMSAGWGMLRGAIDGMMENTFIKTQLDKDKYIKIVEKMILRGLEPLDE